MYKGEPAFNFFISWLSPLIANPKSAKMGYPLLSRILAGFMSRWMMSWSERYLRACRSPCRILREYEGLRYLAWWIFFSRSPPSQ